MALKLAIQYYFTVTSFLFYTLQFFGIYFSLNIALWLVLCYNYIDFDFKKIFLGSLCINDDILKITYDYDNYDSIEHYHQIYLKHSNLIFEYYNELDETIVKEHMEE